MAEPWDRLDDESARAFAAFAAYREMGDARSLAQVGRDLGKSTVQMEKWSARYGWVDRTRSFDARVDQARQGSYLDEIARMAERHAQYAQLMLTAIMLPARELLERVAADPDQKLLRAMSVPDLVVSSRLAGGVLASVANLERLTRGLPTERSDDGDAGSELAGARDRLEELLDRIYEARQRKAAEA